MIKCCVNTIQFTMLVRTQYSLNVYSNMKIIWLIYVCFLKKLSKYLTHTITQTITVVQNCEYSEIYETHIDTIKNI